MERFLVKAALLFAVVTKGDAYLFHRLDGFSGGVRSLSCSCPLVLLLEIFETVKAMSNVYQRGGRLKASEAVFVFSPFPRSC